MKNLGNHVCIRIPGQFVAHGTDDAFPSIRSKQLYSHKFNPPLGWACLLVGLKLVCKTGSAPESDSQSLGIVVIRMFS